MLAIAAGRAAADEAQRVQVRAYAVARLLPLVEGAFAAASVVGGRLKDEPDHTSENRFEEVIDEE